MSRYIDADEAKRQIQKATMGQCDVMKVFLNTMYRIDKIPTADVRENVRGEWISKIVECSRENYDQVFCCSVCGVSNDWRRTNFCPHCGADMRREMEKHFKKDKVL